MLLDGTAPVTLPASIDERIDAALASMPPAEQRMASYFRAQKESVLLSSAAEIAQRAGTSDATVVRTAKSLGFEGLSELRQALLSDLTSRGPEGRLSRTLDDVDKEPGGALSHVLRVHRETLEVMASSEFAASFENALRLLSRAKSRFVFGIGPSGSVAEYASLQLNRLGLRSTAMTSSGVALADTLMNVQEGDVVVLIAYAPMYREVEAILEHSKRAGAEVVHIGNSLGAAIHKKVAEILPVPRGRADHLSLHAGTMLLIEAMIVGLAAMDRERAIAALAKLGSLRGDVDRMWRRRGVRGRDGR